MTRQNVTRGDMSTKLLLGHLCLLGLVQISLQQTSCAGPIGNNPTAHLANNYTQDTDYQFLVRGDPVGCYGVIQSWSFFVSDILNTSCHDVTFQVWRPVGGSDYVLVGTNFYPCDDTVLAATDTLAPMIVEQIPVQTGDIYGWADEGAVGQPERMFNYDDALGGSLQYFQTDILSSPGCTGGPGSTCDWSGKRGTEVRGYSLQPDLTARPNPPYFTNLPQTTTIAENSPAGTHVYQVIAYNDFNYNDVVNPDLVYSTTGTTCTTASFSIDPITGNITLDVATLDFETDGPTCTVTVEVSEGPVTTTDTLTIDIQDVNEPHTIISLPAVEEVDCYNTGGGARVHTVGETDIDTGPGQPAKVYQIVSMDPPSAPFTINNNNGRVDTSQNMRYWAGPTLFVLGIVVQDGYQSAGPEDLTINIINLREKPKIVNLDHTVTIPENNAAMPLHTVEAWPQPDGASDFTRGAITYHINKIYPLTVTQNTFQINAGNGEVTHVVPSGFDHFLIPEYNVEIYALYSMAGQPPDFQSDLKNLTVQITHVNEPPYHQPWATNFFSEIKEKEPIGTALPGVSLDAYDRDIPVGDWIHFTLSGTGSHLFRADNITNLVYVVGDVIVPDYQTDITYMLDLNVVDSYGETNTTLLEVFITDINDHNPVFTGDPYSGSIDEESPGGTGTGAFVFASDRDGGLNGNIRYTILEPEASLYFQVDTTTREITNKQPIPYELYPSMTFTVVATDQGDPELNDTASVFIEILDANTHEPIFTPDFVSLDVRSDTSVNDIVYTVNATDTDTNTVQDVTYYWLIIDDHFTLGKASGEVFVDRELVAFRKHLLYIGAQDAEGANNNHHSDPFTLRLDTYKPETTLVDIHLNVPIESFLQTQDQFLATLNAAIPQWDMRIESVRLEGDDTVVRVYAVESALPDQKQNQHMDKEFVDEDQICDLLRDNLRGDPTDVLKSPEFAAWEPVAVHPAYPIWIIDTPGGVALLSILCALVLAGIITMFVLLAKKYGWCCYKDKGPKMRRVAPVGDEDQFKMSYRPDGDSPPPYHISSNRSLGNTYGGYPGPQYPMDMFSAAPADKLPPKPKPSSANSRATPSKKMMRTSLNEKDPDHYLPPVQDPEPDARPLPRQQGGQTP